MKWFKSSKKEDEEEDNARALVKQDPRTKVKTTTAQSETTNTTTQNSTIFNNNKNTVTYQSTKQTVTSRQTARITEITSRRTPTPEEFEEMMRLLHLSKKPETKTFTTTTTSSSVPLRRNRPNNLPALPSSQRNSQNGISPKSATKFKSTVSPISRLIFNYESSAQGSGSSTGDGSKTPKTPTIVKTSTTTVTEKNGRTVTQRVEEHRIKFDAKNFKLSTPNSPLTKNFTTSEDSYKFDARPILPALPAPSRLSSSSIASNNSSSSSSIKTSISKPTSTSYASTYTSPYKLRELNRTTPLTTTTYSSSFTKPSFTTTTKTTTTAAATKPTSTSIFTTTSRPNSSFSLSTPKSTASTYMSNISKPTPLFTSSSATKTSTPTVLNKPTTTTTASSGSPILVASGKTITTPLCKPGYAYIFNNVIFDNPNNEERIGSAEDVKALVATFEYYKMKVTVIENAKVEKIRKTVEKSK